MVRSIQVLVREDRLIVLPDRAQSPNEPAAAAAGGHEASLRGRVADSAPEIFNALKRHADSWGIAGKGMYWKPRVRLLVAPGAEGRAEEVTRLLRGAGVPVQAATPRLAGESREPTSTGGVPDASRR